MKVGEILLEADRLGVILQAQGDQLHFRAPKGTITPEFRQALVQNRPLILKALQHANSPAVSPTTSSSAKSACLRKSVQDQHWLTWLENWWPKFGERLQ